jgi:hypothetical protein
MNLASGEHFGFEFFANVVQFHPNRHRTGVGVQSRGDEADFAQQRRCHIHSIDGDGDL